MIGKAVVFGVGYAMGARAGHDRYRQIETLARLVTQRLRDQETASRDEVPLAGDDVRRRSTRRGRDDYADIRLGR